MVAILVSTTLVVIATPEWLRGLEDYRTRAAARHLAQRLGDARFRALRQSTFEGLRFEAGPDDYWITSVADGNDNGIRTTELQQGIDRTLSPRDRLGWHFRNVTFGLLPGVPDADGQVTTSTDGVRVGISRILSMNPNGTSSSGTLYLRGGVQSQYAVRVLGVTARVRVLKFDTVRQRWVDQ